MMRKDLSHEQMFTAVAFVCSRLQDDTPDVEAFGHDGLSTSGQGIEANCASLIENYVR